MEVKEHFTMALPSSPASERSTVARLVRAVRFLERDFPAVTRKLVHSDYNKA